MALRLIELFGDFDPRLAKKALYVEPLAGRRRFDITKPPSNGIEYIHIQRIQNAKLERAWKKALLKEMRESPKVPASKEQKQYDYQYSLVARHFSDVAKKIKSERLNLKKLFPNKSLPPMQNEAACCCYILGSELCAKMYPAEMNENFQEGKLPLLSIVLHIEQEDIFCLLKQMFKWYQAIGNNDILMKWFYAVLSCLERPPTDECEDLLLQIYRELPAKSKKGSESDKKKFFVFRTILENYFFVHTYEVGASLIKLQECNPFINH